ncbi:MAG TPA: DnaA N-terminal domain-containing protein, partial [Turneriella sp.]|nr:DnaA N-terminal domain-containing protein [Turneriella sp.]
MLHTEQTAHQPVQELLLAGKTDYWATIKERVQQKIPAQVFTIFFAELEARWENNTLFIICPSAEVKKHLQGQYRRLIAEEIKALGLSAEIQLLDNAQVTRENPPVVQQKTVARAETAFPNKIDLNPNYT